MMNVRLVYKCGMCDERIYEDNGGEGYTPTEAYALLVVHAQARRNTLDPIHKCHDRQQGIAPLIGFEEMPAS
jgi:hypothetical protein